MENNIIDEAGKLIKYGTSYGLAKLNVEQSKNNKQNEFTDEQVLSLYDNNLNTSTEKAELRDQIYNPQPKPTPTGFIAGVQTGFDKFSKVVTGDKDFTPRPSQGVMAGIGETIGNPAVFASMVATAPIGGWGGIIAGSLAFSTTDTLSDYYVDKINDPNEAHFNTEKFLAETGVGVATGGAFKLLEPVTKPIIDKATGLLSDTYNSAKTIFTPKQRILTSPTGYKVAQDLKNNMIPAPDGSLIDANIKPTDAIQTPELSQLNQSIFTTYDIDKLKHTLTAEATPNFIKHINNNYKDIGKLTEDAYSIRDAQSLYKLYPDTSELIHNYNLYEYHTQASLQDVLYNEVRKVLPDEHAKASDKEITNILSAMSNDDLRLGLRYAQKLEGWDIIDGVPMNKEQLNIATSVGEILQGLNKNIIKQINVKGNIGEIQGYIPRNYSNDVLMKYSDEQLVDLFQNAGASFVDENGLYKTATKDNILNIRDMLLDRDNKGTNLVTKNKSRVIHFTNPDGEWMINKALGLYHEPIDIFSQIIQRGTKKISQSNFFGQDPNKTIQLYGKMNVMSDKDNKIFSSFKDRVSGNIAEPPIDDIMNTMATVLNTYAVANQSLDISLNLGKFLSFGLEDLPKQFGNMLNEYGVPRSIRLLFNDFLSNWTKSADFVRKTTKDYVRDGIDVTQIASITDRRLYRINQFINKMRQLNFKYGLVHEADKIVNRQATMVLQSDMKEIIAKGGNIAGVDNKMLKLMQDKDGWVDTELLNPYIDELTNIRDGFKQQLNDKIGSIADEKEKMAVQKIMDSMSTHFDDIDKFNKLIDENTKILDDYNLEKQQLIKKLNRSKSEANKLKHQDDIDTLNEYIDYTKLSIDETKNNVKKLQADINDRLSKDEVNRIMGDMNVDPKILEEIKSIKDKVFNADMNLSNAIYSRDALTNYMAAYQNRVIPIVKDSIGQSFSRGIFGKLIAFRRAAFVFDAWKRSQYKVFSDLKHNLLNKNFSPILQKQLPSLLFTGTFFGGITTAMDVFRDPDRYKTSDDIALHTMENMAIASLIGGLYIPAMSAGLLYKGAKSVYNTIADNKGKKLDDFFIDNSYLFKLYSLIANSSHDERYNK